MTSARAITQRSTDEAPFADWMHHDIEPRPV
jgi:hypothetical protein